MAAARTWLFLAVVIVAALLAWRVLTGPDPSPADAPADGFSAARAMTDVAAIATEPHPVGSPQDAAVRDLLIGRMTTLGLSPRVQATTQVSDKTHLPVRVDTLIGVLPGRDPAQPAVAVMAHYDSTPHGPGAADDAAGVGAALEIARAIKNGPAPLRDVAFVITDGEEAGMLGAKAFFADDPLARRLGFVVNMEARGSRGRAMMFETGRDNGGTVGLFANAAQRPISNSLMVLVYDLMPNFTDFTEGKKRGQQGVNFAFLGGPKDYHAAADTPANLDQRSLQDIGQQALSLTRAVAQGPLPIRAPNLVYSDVLNLGVLAYPPVFGWLVLGVNAALIAIGAWRTKRVSLRAAGWGALASAALLAAAGLLLFTAQQATAALKWRVDELTLEIEVIGWMIAALTMVVWFRLIPTRRGAWMGMLATGLVLGVIVQVLAPGAAPVLVWPLIPAALASALTNGGTRRLWLIGLLAIPALAFAMVLSHLAYLSLLSPLPLAAWPWIAGLLLTPLSPWARARYLGKAV
jgi:hypothetical protein